MKLIKNINYDLNGLVSLITQDLNNYNYLNPKSESEIKSLTLNYNKNLYGTNAFNDFSDLNNNSFKGKVISVDRKGVIKVQKKDNSFHNFNFHEIQMIFN